MDALAALKLQVEWGADEALADAPVVRLGSDRPVAPLPAVPPAPPAPAPAPVAAASSASGSAAPTVAARAEALAAACTSLAALRAALESFDGCPLRDTATHLVFAEGAENPDMLLVSDAPGPEEDRSGRPFAGRQGQLLDQMLASVRLDRRTMLAAPLLPWRPPGDRPPSEAEIAACLPFLRRLIVLARPPRILLFGQQGPKALLPQPPGRTRRAAPPAWAEIALPDGVKIPALPLPALSAVARMPSARRQAWDALRLLRRTLDRQAAPGTG